MLLQIWKIFMRATADNISAVRIADGGLSDGQIITG